MTEKTSTVLKESWYFFTANFSSLAIFVLPFFLISASTSLYTVLDPKSQFSNILHVIDISILSPLLNGGLLLLIHSLVNTDDKISFTKVITLCFPFWFSLFIVSFISETAISIGFLLLILPGIWIMIRLFLAPLYVLFQGLSANEAIKTSFIDSKDLFKEFLTPTLPLISITLVMIFLNGENESSSYTVTFIKSLITSFIFMFFSIVQYRLYSIYIPKK